MQLNVYDMDGTIVDSTAAIRQCHAEELYLATWKDIQELESMISKYDKSLYLNIHNTGNYHE